MVNILYLSCHDVLEFNEIQVLNSLGHNVKVLGFLTDPHNPTSKNINPLYNLPRDEDFINKCKAFLPADPRTVYRITDPTILEGIDVIIVCHSYEHIKENEDLFAGKNLIRRTVTQGNAVYESWFQRYVESGMKVVRFSKNESKMPHYQGFDWVVQPCVDKISYNPALRTGHIPKLLTIKNSALKNSRSCQYHAYLELLCEGLIPDTFVGNNNEDVPGSIGAVSQDELKNLIYSHRVGFCLPSRPGSITYTMIEYLMSGLPIAAFGPIFGNSSHPIEGPVYEIHELITQGIEGFCCDDIRTLRKYVHTLLQEPDLANQIGAKGRLLAEKLFSHETSAIKWKEVLDNILT